MNMQNGFCCTVNGLWSTENCSRPGGASTICWARAYRSARVGIYRNSGVRRGLVKYHLCATVRGVLVPGSVDKIDEVGR